MKKRRRLASITAAIAYLSEPAPPPSTWEVIQHHPASCRTNLLAWNLTGPEASRILDQLEEVQCARRGAILICGKPEMGWVYLAREASR